MKSLLELVQVIATLVWITALLWVVVNFASVEMTGTAGTGTADPSVRGGLIVFGVAVAVFVLAALLRRRTG
jgi:hypothetical protein